MIFGDWREFKNQLQTFLADKVTRKPILRSAKTFRREMRRVYQNAYRKAGAMIGKDIDIEEKKELVLVALKHNLARIYEHGTKERKQRSGRRTGRIRPVRSIEKTLKRRGNKATREIIRGTEKNIDKHFR